MAASLKRRIATHIEVEWLDQPSPEMICPNCGALAPMRQLLDIDYRPPDAEHRFILQVCPVCTVRFVDNPEMMDYGTDELIEIGWNTYQVQLGAGVWPISAPLTRVAKPAGARVLEIGGAYGFGLDFCIRARGWRGQGYDPSPLAAFGARELGLTIHQEYFGEAQLAAGPWDVVISTEVIEHLAHPPAFLALMRRALAADGMLVMTTPDAAWITPELSAGALMPLLSPGAHAVLQTARSLEVALRAAGFAQVTVLRESTSLIAYASAAPFTLIEDTAAARAMYRRYLVERAGLTEPMSDLRLGFAGRGLFEAANDGDAAAVETAWAALLPAAQARFGLNLETLTELPAGAAAASLAELAQLMPLGLGMILFGRVMHLVSAGRNRAELLPMLLVAKAAIAALQNALAKRSLTDLLSASIGGIIETEILLCHAEAGDPACLPALIATADELTGWRGFVALVNADALGLAAALQTALLPAVPSAAMPRDLRRNGLLSLANFALAPGGATERAFEYAQHLRELGEDVDGILLAGFARLVNASRYEEALAVIAAHDIDTLAKQEKAGEAGRDARLARMVLDLAAGDPAAIPARLEGMEIEPARRDVLLMEAFTRLVDAARNAEARAFLVAHDIAALARRIGGAAGGDAAIAMALLELADGDPALVPEIIADAELAAERRVALLLAAFTGLVNAARYAAARALQEAEPAVAALARATGPEAEDARLSSIVLDLQTGHTEAALRQLSQLANHGGAPAVLAPLWVDSFIRLVNQGKFAAAAELGQGRFIEARLADCKIELRHDAITALLMLDLQHGGEPARIVQRIEQALEANMPEGRVQALALAAFVTLVNRGEFGTARLLLRLVEPVLIKLRPPYGEAHCNGLFAAGILFLQERDDWRKSATTLARLRDDLVKRANAGAELHPLFWPGLRGEVLALQRLNRGADASMLLQSFIGAYPGAPDDLIKLTESS